MVRAVETIRPSSVRHNIIMPPTAAPEVVALANALAKLPFFAECE
jgi:hypothetical protein